MKKITSAYISYDLDNGSTAGVRVASFKNINPVNSFKLSHRRHIGGAVNYIVSLFAYWSDRKGKPVDRVIVTDKLLAQNIGCSKSHAFIVANQIKVLFNMEFTRQKYRGGARSVRLNKTFIDFIKIYTEEEYDAFITAHNIQDSERLYALRQVYDYRIWGLTDSQLSRTEKEAKRIYIEDMKDHLHFVATSNKSDLARIETINKYSKHLSEMQTKQLSKIREASKLGKLVHYLHKVLIRLEQKVLLIKYHAEKDKTDNNNIDPSLINRNMNPGKSAAEVGASAVAQKIPEDDPEDMNIKDYYSFMALWNYLAIDNFMPRMEKLTEERKQSINQLAKSNSKGDLFTAVKNIRRLYHDSTKYKYKMTFERFSQDETFLHVLEINSFDPRIEDIDFMDKIEGVRTLNNIVNEIPEFITHEEAKEWWKLNK